MNEKPMLFSGPMVRAILDGRKTQTRRITKDSDSQLNDCRYQVGDRIWVRETWALLAPMMAPVYRADYGPDDDQPSPWKPSIHMSHKYCRLLLDVTDVHAERLQEITNDDAIAEGAQIFDDIPLDDLHKRYPQNADRWSMESPVNTGQCLGTPRYAFANLWDKLNQKRGYGWNTSPWVWVIKFTHVQED